MSLLVALVFLFSRCFDGGSGSGFRAGSGDDPRGEGYAGANACVGCHGGGGVHSNHFRASAAGGAAEGSGPGAGLGGAAGASASGLASGAGAGARGCVYFADSSYVQVEGDEHGIFQTHFVKGQKAETGRVDVVFGSGEKAQTFGYWKDSVLYQLPLSFFAGINSWANSPGFSGGHARFDRVIVSRCFECHASYVSAEFIPTGPLSVSERLDKNSIVYGIDCERCHGPALRHVRYQQENPTDKTARYITAIRSLSRQRQMDVCAVCHSGNERSAQRSLFGFVPGDTLSNYYYPAFASGMGEPDVHGQQVQMLQASLCYQKTEMTCGSCHEPHGGVAAGAGVPGVGVAADAGSAGVSGAGSASGAAMGQSKAAAFIARCMDCHGQSAHAVAVLKENEQKKRDFNLTGLSCIDCHMPMQISKTIYFNNGAGSKNIPYYLRTHKIAVYK